MRRLLVDPNAALGLALVVLLILAAILAPALASHDPTAISLATAYRGPSGDHGFGTDEVGRDILSRVLYGTRLSLMTGFAAVGVALALGLPIGMLAGFGGRAADLLLMGMMDVLLAFPTLLLAILIVTILGPGVESAMLAVGLSSVPVFARLVRASALVIREADYVTAAIGSRPLRVALRPESQRHARARAERPRGGGPRTGSPGPADRDA